MLESLRRLVPSRIQARGDEYFLSRRVVEAGSGDDGVIYATVRGSREYFVTIDPGEKGLLVECDCPYFLDRGEVCKHVWAALRAAHARKLLGDGPVEWIDENLTDNDDPEGEDGAAWIRGAASTPAGTNRPWSAPPPRLARWMNFFRALPRPSVAPPSSGAAIPEELAYVLGVSGGSSSISIRIMGRSRKKNGDWRKWRNAAIQFTQLERLPGFDRDTLALLTRYSTYTLDAMHSIPAHAARWWLERLSTAGRLFDALRDGELVPLRWDGGEPWDFRVAVDRDEAASVYRITGTLARDGETLPLTAVRLALPDVLVLTDRIARLSHSDTVSWFHALRMHGSVEVPFADQDRLRDALLDAPAAAIQLPDELAVETVATVLRPLLLVKTEGGFATDLVADLWFLYDDWRVHCQSEEMRRTEGHRVIRRDLSRENGYRGRLLPLTIAATWGGHRIRAAHFEEIARTLIEEGWRVEFDGGPVHAAGALDLEIVSGIDWFDLAGGATFGTQRIELPRLLEAVEHNRSTLRLADGSVGLVPSQWLAALAPALGFGQQRASGVRYSQSQALILDSLLGTHRPRVDQHFAELRTRLLDARPVPQTEPPSFTGELRPYQRDGLGWLAFLREVGIGGCLADDMGLGKTVQLLAFLESQRSASGRPSLVVAPRSLLFNWKAEAARFAPRLRVVEHHGNERARELPGFDECDLVLTTYATMRIDIEALSKIEFDTVILDESQAIKNASSLVAKAARRLRSPHRLALSGTPIENHLGELWSLFDFLNPGLLGSARMFQRTFAGKTVPPERRELLARALRPLILRRTKEQVAPELPERVEQTLWCELEGKQRKQYDELRVFYQATLLSSVRAKGLAKSKMQVLEALLRLRQAACHPALIDGRSDSGSAKLDLLLAELDELRESGHRALVFSQFTSFLALVRGALDDRGIAYSYLDGKTVRRESVVKAFQSDDGPRLFLISLKAGGLGLNLTNADYVFLLDPWWNPAVEAQAIDRAHRIGRTRPVIAYRLIARDTVEEKILELQSRKRELADSILSEDNSVMRKLEIEDLEMLLG